MNKQLETELTAALEQLRNAAVPLTDAQVRQMIDGLKELAAKIVAWNLEGDLPW